MRTVHLDESAPRGQGEAPQEKVSCFTLHSETERRTTCSGSSPTLSQHGPPFSVSRSDKGQWPCCLLEKPIMFGPTVWPFVCLSDEDGLNHTDPLLKPKHTAKEMGRTLGFEDLECEESSVVTHRVFRMGTVQTGQLLDIEPDFRHTHTPLINSESGCTANTKTARTPRQKLQDKLVLDKKGKRPILEEGRRNTIQICLHEIVVFDKHRLDLAEKATHWAQRFNMTLFH